MEVASPLTVPHAAAGTKRSLVCSPGIMDTTTRNPFATVGMDMTDDTMQRAFKRRRFQADTAMGDAENSSDYPPFMNMALARSKSMFPNNGEFHENVLYRAPHVCCGPFDLRRLEDASLDCCMPNGAAAAVLWGCGGLCWSSTAA